MSGRRMHAHRYLGSSPQAPPTVPVGSMLRWGMWEPLQPRLPLPELAYPHDRETGASRLLLAYQFSTK